MSAFRNYIEESYNEEMEPVYRSEKYRQLDATVEESIAALKKHLNPAQSKLLDELLDDISNRDGFVASNAYVQGARAVITLKCNDTIE